MLIGDIKFIKRKFTFNPNGCKKCSCYCCFDKNTILTHKDINRIKMLGYESGYFVRKYGIFKFLKMSNNGNCVFLKENKCLIYDHRPYECRWFPIYAISDNYGVINIRDECSFINESLKVIEINEFLSTMNCNKVPLLFAIKGLFIKLFGIGPK